MKNVFIKVILTLALLSLFAGCLQQTRSGNTSQTVPVQEELRLATSTSTCNTGILDILNKKFEEMSNIKVLTICEGTGRAISRGELGEADVVIGHAVPLELKAVANGSLINRRYMMYNYFVIIGPESDPAGIKNAANASDAFRRIAAKQSSFISRGDGSGTYQMEKSIWETANITPAGTWYQSIDKDLEETIITADAKGSYTLSDRGTYIAVKDKIKLRALFEKDKLYLFNPYHVMAVNPKKFPSVKYNLAVEYIDYIISPDAQDIIRNYGNDKYEEALFIPVADTSED